MNMEFVGAVDAQHDVSDGREIHKPSIRMLVGILTQAIEDAIWEPIDSEIKFDATHWLCEENNKLLQLCLFVANMDQDKILRKVAREGWNLDL